jgi:hypothetical protein
MYLNHSQARCGTGYNSWASKLMSLVTYYLIKQGQHDVVWIYDLSEILPVQLQELWRGQEVTRERERV